MSVVQLSAVKGDKPGLDTCAGHMLEAARLLASDSHSASRLSGYVTIAFYSDGQTGFTHHLVGTGMPEPLWPTIACAAISARFQEEEEAE